jgi:ArsR family transcriptional regulator, arsenate/arsenite/antimonite-responsive transcriptional repressor
MTSPQPIRATSLSERARLFQALSDETRLAILDMLRHGERCVCDLQDALGVAQSRLSFHLKVLRDAGMVQDRKEGRWSYYTINPDRLEAAAAAAGGYARPAARQDRSASPPLLHRLTRGHPRASLPRAKQSRDCCS